MGQIDHEERPKVDLSLVHKHLVKRMYDECGTSKADDFVLRVSAGEHDVPSPWSKSSQHEGQERDYFHKHYTKQEDGMYVRNKKPGEEPVAEKCVDKFFGIWPGDETDTQLLATIDEVREVSLPNDEELVKIANEIFPDDPGFLRTVWKDGIDIEQPTIKYCELSLRLTQSIRKKHNAALRELQIMAADNKELEDLLNAAESELQQLKENKENKEGK